MEKWITQLHKHAWWLLDTLKVTSVHKLDSSMKVSPSPVWELALFCIKEPFSQGGREPYFPALKPHREVPYPNYMEMSLVSVSKGGALMSCAADPKHSAVISEIPGHPWEFGCQCAACDVFLTLSLGCLCARRCCQMEKQVSCGIQTTNSQSRPATRVCNTHVWKEESWSERGSWIPAHRSEESWQSLCVHHSSVCTV